MSKTQLIDGSVTAEIWTQDQSVYYQDMLAFRENNIEI